MNEVIIDGITYVPKDEQTDGMPYCIIRTNYAGVFAGYVEDENKDQVVLVNSRRLWRWDGAASLSELSQKGTKKPDTCKFPCVEPRKIINGWIEMIPCSENARISIQGVKEWEA